MLNNLHVTLFCKYSTMACCEFGALSCMKKLHHLSTVMKIHGHSVSLIKSIYSFKKKSISKFYIQYITLEMQCYHYTKFSFLRLNSTNDASFAQFKKAAQTKSSAYLRHINYQLSTSILSFLPMNIVSETSPLSLISFSNLLTTFLRQIKNFPFLCAYKAYHLLSLTHLLVVFPS